MPVLVGKCKQKKILQMNLRKHLLVTKSPHPKSPRTLVVTRDNTIDLFHGEVTLQPSLSKTKSSFKRLWEEMKRPAS